MTNKLEVTDVANRIFQASQELRRFPNQLYERAKAYAEAEKKYRIALMKAELELKKEGMPATLIHDIARGKVAELKFERDAAEKLWEACKTSARVKESEQSGLQSVYRHLDEV